MSGFRLSPARSPLNVEKFPSVIAAMFAGQTGALGAIDGLHADHPWLETAQLQLIRPSDRDWQHRLEADSAGVRRTRVKSHLFFAAAGVLTGSLVASALVLLGKPFAVSNVAAVFAIFAVLGGVLGLLAGGLFALRPDHQFLVNAVSSALQHNHYVVIVHTRDAARYQAVYRSLAALPATLVGTLRI